MGRGRYWDDVDDEPAPADLAYERAEQAAISSERERQRIAQEAAIKASANAGLEEANRRALLREYERHGLEPVYADKGKTIMLSLSMLLHMGWRVEEAELGVKVLTKPNKEARDADDQASAAGR